MSGQVIPANRSRSLPRLLEGIILDLVSVAESLREKGDEVNAAIVNMVIDQLDGFIPD